MLSRERAFVQSVALLVLAMMGVGEPGAAATPSGMEIVTKALQSQAGVQDYVATVSVTVEAPNVQIPKRTMTVYYKAPDKLHVESEGLVVLPRDALLMGNLSKHVQEDTDATLIGQGTLKGRPVYCAKLTPKEEQDNQRRVLCWIDAERYLLMKSEMWHGSTKALTITLTHTQQGGKYWMPTSIACRIPGGVLGDAAEPASITVSFSDYQVNTGLADSIFEEDD